MSFKSKRTITTMAVSLIVTAAYIFYTMSNPLLESRSLKAWALLIMVFIGISVAALIVVLILFHIAYSIGIAVKEGGEDEGKIERLISSAAVEDEMDSIIGMKSARAGQVCTGIGFGIALIMLALGYSAVWALHIQLASMLIGTLLEGGISIYLYERGV